jgi:hypothetical protein
MKVEIKLINRSRGSVADVAMILGNPYESIQLFRLQLS